MKSFLYLLIIAGFFSACSSPKKNKNSLSKEDKILFQIGECSRSRYNNVASACLEKFKTHVFKGKVVSVDFAYSGVKSLVDIGTTRVTCHSHPTDQNFQVLKDLLIGDLVVVNGVPGPIHSYQNHNTLILRDCLLLPISR